MAKVPERRLPVQDTGTVDPALLETFPYEYPGKDITVTISSDEFTALCPWSGLPDFGTVTIDYVPDRVCIELRSLKYYLLSYRTVGIYQEHATCRILEDLVRSSKPRRMKVTADYKVRGGIHTVVSREYVRRTK